MDSPLVSIIVPVYKVEEYLDRAVNSLLNQSYNNLEIILVDDGSPDRCPKMCDDYAKKDARVKVIHQKNGGLSAARNAALNVSNGDYLTFLDSDDYLHHDAIGVFLNEIISSNADVVCCSVEIINDLSETVGSFKCENVIEASGLEVSKRILRDTYPYNFAWGKFYKSNLFKAVRFPLGRIYEDTATTYRVIAKARKVICLPTCLYYYYRGREGNITSELNSKRAAWSYLCGCINCKEFLQDFAGNEDFNDVITDIQTSLFKWIKLCVESAIKTGIDNYKDYCHKLDDIIAQTGIKLPSRLKLIMKFRILYYYLYRLLGRHR